MIHADGTGLHELAPGMPADGKTAPDISPDGKKVVFSVVGQQGPGLGGRHRRRRSAAADHGLQRRPDVCMEGDPRTRRRTADRVRASCRPGHEASSASGTSRPVTVTMLEIDAPRRHSRRRSGNRPGRPTGTQIAFGSSLRTTRRRDASIDSQIFIVNADGSGLHRHAACLPGPPWGDPDWSPDGSRIVVQLMADRRLQHDKVRRLSARDRMGVTSSSSPTSRAVAAGHRRGRRWSTHPVLGTDDLLDDGSRRPKPATDQPDETHLLR